MADPVRKQILDAVVTALEGISGIGRVSTELKSWEELHPKDFPAAFPIIGEILREPAYFEHATSPDMNADMELTVVGYVFDKGNKVILKRDTLEKDIEVALRNDTALAALIVQIDSEEPVASDQGVVKNYGVFDYPFHVIFEYNHNTP